MRKFIAIAALLIVTVLVALAFWPSTSRPRQFESGAALAKVLIQRAAENQGVATLSGLGGKVCVAPGGASGDFYPNRLFPAFLVAYRETDESSGYWFAIIGFEATRTVEIYGIPKPVLLWDYPTNTVPMADLVTCPSELLISEDGGTVFLKSGPKRVPRIESMRADDRHSLMVRRVSAYARFKQYGDGLNQQEQK